MQLKCWRLGVLGFYCCFWERVSLCCFINPPGLVSWVLELKMWAHCFQWTLQSSYYSRPHDLGGLLGQLSLVGTLSQCSLPQTGPPSKKILYSCHHNLILWAFKITLAKHIGFVGRRWSDSGTPGCQHSFSSGAWVPWNLPLRLFLDKMALSALQYLGMRSSLLRIAMQFGKSQAFWSEDAD